MSGKQAVLCAGVPFLLRSSFSSEKVKEDGKLREGGVLLLATSLIWEKLARVAGP